MFSCYCYYFRVLRIFFFAATLLLVNFSASAQAVRVITTKDGLPQSFVSGLVQDADGFVWIATRNGLARYDGIQFKTFLHNIRDTNSIATNLIIWIRLDKHNQIWIEHESGEIDRLDPRTEQIEHFSKIHAFAKRHIDLVRRGWVTDASERFWSIGAAGGLNRLDPRNNKTYHYTTKNKSLPSDTLRGLLQSKPGKIWVLGQIAISAFNEHTGKFDHYFLPTPQDYNTYYSSERDVIDLHERNNGELMWGDRQHLYFFDPNTHKFRTEQLPATGPLGVRWIRTGPNGIDHFESGEQIYRYIDGKGIIKVRRISGSLDACSFLVDRSGLIWTGTNVRGIEQLDLTTPFFRSFNNEQGFHQDLFKQEFHTGMDKVFDWKPWDGSLPGSSYYFRSGYDASGRLWMALKETVCYYDERTRQLVTLPPVKLVQSREDMGVGIQGITFNANGSPVIVSYNGKIRTYDKAQKQWMPFMDDHLIRKTYGQLLICRDILDDNERLWITTDGDGLLAIDRKTKQLHQFKHQSHPATLPTDKLLAFKVDPTRPYLLWIGSYEGLICLDKRRLKSKVYSLNEGLPDNTIYSILADKAGNLWLSTNKGLCRFHPVTHRVRVFQTSYGLPGNEFNRFHHLQLPDGRMAFGGPDGWTMFEPDAVKDDLFEPNIAFTDLKVNNVTVTAGPNGLLARPINNTSHLELSYGQNTVTFQFAGLQYDQPQDISYRYQLVGYDDKWVHAGHSAIANYTKIPPGEYTLKINSSNTSGKWSSHIKQLNITIGRPWWRSWLAYVCYALSIGTLMWVYTRYRIRNELMDQDFKNQERETKQLREMDEIKSRFFSNITHEFRTPLTLILGPAERLRSGQLNTKEQEKLAATIESNAKHLLNLINQLMDMAKLEAHALTPHEAVGSPAATVNSIVASFMEEVNTRQILLGFDDRTHGRDYSFAADVLGHIVYNLVGNAIKFTPASGSITVSLVPLTQGLSLIVQDTGTGIPPEKLPHIFDRFFQAGRSSKEQAADQRGQGGTGIGLSLVKELVELQNGKIEVESISNDGDISGSGTTFTVTLPYSLISAPILSVIAPEVKSAEYTPVIYDSGMTPVILVVEDNPDLAAFITSSLNDMYQVHHTLNGAEGIKIANELMPDLILSDVLMPVMDGVTMCRLLKQDVRTSHIPVILLTARSSAENRTEGLEQGADDYLSKPFQLNELLLRIQNMLKRQQSFKEHVTAELSLTGQLPAQTPNAVHDAFITQLYDLIEEHLNDEDFGVDQMIGHMNMSRSSLHRKIKNISGMSTAELLRNYRLKRASQLLQQGFSSSDTAYRTGFNSPAYFSKCFRELYGSTPIEYVKRQIINY